MMRTLVARSWPHAPDSSAKYRNSYWPLAVGAVVVNETLVSGVDGAVCVPFMYHHATPLLAPIWNKPTQS